MLIDSRRFRRPVNSDNRSTGGLGGNTDFRLLGASSCGADVVLALEGPAWISCSTSASSAFKRRMRAAGVSFGACDDSDEEDEEERR
jgi:hypothetical protein